MFRQAATSTARAKVAADCTSTPQERARAARAKAIAWASQWFVSWKQPEHDGFFRRKNDGFMGKHDDSDESGSFEFIWVNHNHNS